MRRTVAFFCSLPLTLTSCGSFLVGTRYLPSDWGSADTMLQAGMNVQLGWRGGESLKAGMWGVPIHISGAHAQGDNKSYVTDLSVGVWFVPWARGEWVTTLPSGGFEQFKGDMVLTYAGGGISYLLAGLYDATDYVDTDGSLGAYVHCGMLMKVGSLAAIGAELRYTFGTEFEMRGAEMSGDGIQLLFQFMFAHWP